jgi:hypothetical protein
MWGTVYNMHHYSHLEKALWPRIYQPKCDMQQTI